jgi:hypothetical protein
LSRLSGEWHDSQEAVEKKDEEVRVDAEPLKQ